MSSKHPGMKPELETRLEQRLTPQLVLTMRVLQLPLPELRELIEAEMEQNPALELSDDEFEPEVESGTGVEGDGDVFGKEIEANPIDIDGKGGDVGDGKETAELTGAVQDLSGSGQENGGEEYSLDDLLPPDGWEMPVPSGGSEDEMPSGEVVANPVVTLRDTILPKLKEEILPEDLEIAEQLLEWLDEDGFLSSSEEEIAAVAGVEPARVQRVLFHLQRIPPGGIGCRSVREALLVQLELKGVGSDSLECRLLRDGWAFLEKRDTTALAKLFGVTEEEIRLAIRRLLSLEPKPGRQFVAREVEYVRPDFSVEWRGDGLVVVVNDEELPRLRLAKRFVEILRSPQMYRPEEVAFARKKLESARMLLRAIESRRQLLRNLVEWIVKTQDGFFLSGSQERLKPATLRDAARVLSVHEATISRAVAGKYLETPYGIFPLKFFFRSGKCDLSRTAIQEKIRVIVEAEDKCAPLSDDGICERLKRKGIVVSRRTVAKYREEMGIPSSRERKAF